MYTQADLDQNTKALRKELVRIGLIALPFCVGIVACFLLRQQFLTTALTILVGALMLFLFNLRVCPLTAYRRYLRNTREGLSREAQGVVVSFSSDITSKEGVDFRTLLINTDPQQTPEGERQFYFDLCKEAPSLNAGDLVHLVCHGNYILSVEHL